MTADLEGLLHCLGHIYHHFQSCKMPPIQTLSLEEALPESDREAPESDQDTTLENEKDALGEILEATVRTVRPLFTALTSLEKKIIKKQ